MGFESFLKSNWEGFYLHSGTGLELLCKAFLASIHPSLVVDGRDFDSLLHACHTGRHSRKPLPRVRTITLTESLSRVGQLVPEITKLNKQLAELAHLRNGVIHAALIDERAASEILSAYLKGVDILVDQLRESRSDYWQELGGVVDSKLSIAERDAAERTKRKVEEARLAYERRVDGLESPELEAFLVSAEYVPIREGNEVGNCPACGRRALFQGWHDVEWEPDFDYSDGQVWVPGATGTVTFYPDYLKCPVCGLELRGMDELSLTGLPPSWVLVDAIPEDYSDVAAEDDFV